MHSSQTAATKVTTQDHEQPNSNNLLSATLQSAAVHCWIDKNTKIRSESLKYLCLSVCVPEYCVSVPAMCVWMCFVSVNVLIECLITLLLEQNYKYNPPAVRNLCVWFCLVNLSTVCACMRHVICTEYRQTTIPARLYCKIIKHTIPSSHISKNLYSFVWKTTMVSSNRSKEKY